MLSVWIYAFYLNNIRHFDKHCGVIMVKKTFPLLKDISRLIAEVEKKTVGQNAVHSIDRVPIIVYYQQLV